MFALLATASSNGRGCGSKRMNYLRGVNTSSTHSFAAGKNVSTILKYQPIGKNRSVYGRVDSECNNQDFYFSSMCPVETPRLSGGLLPATVLENRKMEEYRRSVHAVFDIKYQARQRAVSEKTIRDYIENQKWDEDDQEFKITEVPG